MNISSLSAEDIISKNESIRAIISEKDKKLSKYEREIEKLQSIIVNANRRQYGSKSEKLKLEKEDSKFEQGKFVFSKEEPKKEVQEPKEQEEIVVESYTRKVTKGRKPLSPNLPREEIVYEPEATHCLCCKHELVKIGEERSEELEKIPAQLKVIEHVRIKKACPKCKGNKVLVPPLPASVFVFEKARPGAGLVADILVSKYLDALPLYRQEQMYLRLGIELPRQRMCDWVQMSAERLLTPIYKALKEEILTKSYIQADETTIKVQDNVIPGKCHQGYMWGLHAPPLRIEPDIPQEKPKFTPALVWFCYDESRSSDVPKRLLEGYTGSIHTDAYAGYSEIFIPDTCSRVACLAHVRRKFIEIQKTANTECTKVLKQIAELYRLENSFKTTEERFTLRQTKSKQKLDDLFSYLKELQTKTLPEALLMKAINYTLRQEKEIYRILNNADFHLDNNSIERQMKPIAIGRKNYLFAGSHKAAQNSAIIYSLLLTCKLNNINPWEWLKDILIRVSSDNTVKARDLLPHRWNKKSIQ